MHICIFHREKGNIAQPAEVAPYRLVEIEDKGRGLVAAKDHEAGDLVFEEKIMKEIICSYLSKNEVTVCF